MRIGLIGDGGREFAIASALIRTGDKNTELFSVCKNKNEGIISLSSATANFDYSAKENIFDFFNKHQVEVVVVGPEAPLMNGVVDYLRENGISVVGANKKQAMLEGDKAFMRNLLKNKIGWGSPAWEVVDTIEKAKSFIDQHGEIVVKPIGLTGGKGVRVMGIQLSDLDETLEYISNTIKTDSVVLLEEKLIGEEFSRMAFVSGSSIRGMPLAQDFKYGFDGDQGLMTGGMGSYTNANHKMPFVSDEELSKADQLLSEVISALNEETQSEYRGFLYGQFMVTRKGIYLIEFNVRLGDPEAINIMYLLESNVSKIMRDVAIGDITKTDIRFKKCASVVKYLVPQQYPKPLSRELFFTLDEGVIEESGLTLVQASVERQSQTTWKALGSRSVGIFGLGKTPEEISDKIENILKKIEPKELRHRKDVADKEILKLKMKRMQELKGF